MKLLERISRSPRLFNGLSWGVTALIVVTLLGATLWHVFPWPVLASSLPDPDGGGGAPVPVPGLSGPLDSGQAIVRRVALKTEMDERINYNVIQYTIRSGDSIFAIAASNNITPETVLWANYDTLQDDPHSIRVGMVLNIPPTDGVYYEWLEGDTLESIAEEYEVSPDDILNWPGNSIDLTDPEIAPGTFVMVPGGKREFFQWIIPTVARGSSGTARVGGTACGGGPVGGGGFIWPTGNHYLSGNDYWSGHLGIDIAGQTGASAWAADAGVVTMAQGGWNYGYGNVVMVDHGNGYVTLYAHLSQINVVPCQGVGAGTLVGLVGSTGNSFGAHLHFEVRQGGGFINPWYVLPPP